jgi:hypothetical protein
VIERWSEPSFLAEAHAWIREQVEPVGPIEQPHVRPWSTVLRIPTRDGDVYFKANALGFEHEARTVAALAPLAPDLLPELVAIDADRDWMLIRDAGTRLREQPDAVRWEDVLARYADLQAAAAPLAADLVAAEVPDRRLAVLPQLYAEVGGRDVAMVVELCAELDAFGMPETIQHDDLHDGQIFVTHGGARILDWGDACLAHPFLTFGVTMSFARHALDAYLSRWSVYGDVERLRPAVSIAMRLDGISRALTWSHVLPFAPHDWRERYGDAIDIWRGRVAIPPDDWD